MYQLPVSTYVNNCSGPGVSYFVMYLQQARSDPAVKDTDIRGTRVKAGVR